MKTLKGTLGKAALFLLIATVLCGFAYTLAVTGIAQIAFPYQANGSIIEVDGKKYGSELLGQQFTGQGHMWGRVMDIDVRTFTGEDGQPLMYAWASNLSPASDEYEKLIADRVKKIAAAHPEKKGQSVPVELVTGSGSGLDPHISVKAAMYQVERIAANTGKTTAEVERIIDRFTQGRFLGIIGEPVVNVLKVNLALEGII